MVLLTMIARLADGLPLAASMQEDEQVQISAVVPLRSLAACRAVANSGFSFETLISFPDAVVTR